VKLKSFPVLPIDTPAPAIGLELLGYGISKVRQKVLAIVQLALPNWIRTPIPVVDF
jgi:hypothetical protein